MRNITEEISSRETGQSYSDELSSLIDKDEISSAKNIDYLAKTVDVRGRYMYLEKNPFIPSSGDFRVSFSKTLCGPITVVGA